MTVEQFVADLDELVDLVCARLAKSTVLIFGHSWGSVLGVLYAERFPHKVDAYVGGGQIGDWPAAEFASYEYALTRQGNRNALKDLRAIGLPPYPAASVFKERTWLQRFDGRLRNRALKLVTQNVLLRPSHPRGRPNARGDGVAETAGLRAGFGGARRPGDQDS